MMDNYPNGMSRRDLIHVGEITELHESRLDWLLCELDMARDKRDKAIDTIDQLNDYIDEIDDEIYELEFGDE